jgi:two-component system cell cycle response regulator DivK
MSRGRIVYLEDNVDIQLLYSEYLRAHGYDVECSSHPEPGLKIIAEHLPDLVILDVQLPEIDGIEVTRRLKEDPRTASIPIYALSSYAMDQDKQRALDAGCDVYLIKPLSPAKLLEHINAFFQQRTESSEA